MGLLSQQPRAAAGVVLLLLLLQLAPQAARAFTANVSNSQEFAAVFVDNEVTHIRLVPPSGEAHYGDIRLEPDSWPYTVDHPCRIRRNLTISSAPAHAILDFNFIQGKCVLEPGLTINFNDTILRNARYGSGVNLDIFVNSPGSHIVLDDVVRYRIACLAARQDPEKVMSLPRPPGFPGAQQAVAAEQFCVRDNCYDHMLTYEDVALESTVSPDQTQYAGGYTVRLLNTTTACEQYVSDECVNQRGGDSCVVEAMNAHIAAQEKSGGGSSDNVIAIVLPVLLCSTLLAGVLVALVLHLRKRRAEAQHEARAAASKLLPAASKQLSGGLGPLGSGDSSGAPLAPMMTSSPSSGWQMIAYRTLADVAHPEGASDSIQLGTLLGTGAYGRVYRGRWLGREVAVKVLQHNVVHAQRVAQECDLTIGSTHPNVLTSLHYVTWRHFSPARSSSSASAGAACVDSAAVLHEMEVVVHDPDASDAHLSDAMDGQTWIVTEYCDGSNLYDASRLGKLTRFRGKPNMLALLHRLMEVAEGMRHLHARGVLHGDLKSSNVLLATQPSAPFGMVAKVADFGLSRALSEGQTHRSTRTLGTVTHMAPALLRSGKMSAESDVYSFGIMMWELLSGKTAFSGMHYGEVVERVVLHDERPAVPAGAPEDYCLLMSKCWAADDRERPSFEGIKQCLAIMVEDRLQEAQQAGDARILLAVARGNSPNSALRVSDNSNTVRPSPSDAADQLVVGSDAAVHLCLAHGGPMVTRVSFSGSLATSSSSSSSGGAHAVASTSSSMHPLTPAMPAGQGVSTSSATMPSPHVSMSWEGEPGELDGRHGHDAAAQSQRHEGYF